MLSFEYFSIIEILTIISFLSQLCVTLHCPHFSAGERLDFRVSLISKHLVSRTRLHSLNVEPVGKKGYLEKERPY